MGSYSTLKIDGFALYSDKDDVNPTVMRVFTDTDKCIRDPLPQGLLTGADSVDADLSSEDGGPGTIVEYSVSLRVARDRLEVMGFTLDEARRAFDEGLREEIER